MSVDCPHGSYGSHLNCPECRMDRIEALLERIADAVAPTPEQMQMASESKAFEATRAALRARGLNSFRPSMTNAIAGPQTGRGVR